MNLSILITILVMGIVLQFSHGHYSHYWVSLTPAFFLLPLSNIKKPESIKIETILVGILLIFQILSIFVFSPIYSIKNTYYSSYGLISYLSFALIIISFFMTTNENINQDSFFKIIFALIFLKLLELGLVVLYSPQPKIDVWYYLQIAADGLSKGQNPYMIEYPQIYKDYKINLPYPPLSIFTSWLSKTIFGDIRMINIFLLGGISSVLYYVSKQRTQDNIAILVALLFLSFPSSPFMIEQAWIDIVGITFLSLSYILFKKEKELLSFFVFGIFLSAKQYHIFFLPVGFYFLKDRKFADILKSALVIILGLLLPFIPFAITNLDALLGRVFQVDSPVSVPNYQSLNSWFVLRKANLGNTLSFILFPIGVMVLSYLNIKGRFASRSNFITPIFSTSIFVMIFLTFYSNSGYNYWWFALGGVWLYLSETLGQESKEDLFYKIDFEYSLFLISRAFIFFGLLNTFGDIPYLNKFSQEYLLGSVKLESASENIFNILISTIIQSFPFFKGMIPELRFKFLYGCLIFVADVLILILLKNKSHDLRKNIVIHYILLTTFLGSFIYSTSIIIFTLPLIYSICNADKFSTKIKTLLNFSSQLFRLDAILYHLTKLFLDKSSKENLRKTSNLVPWGLGSIFIISLFYIFTGKNYLLAFTSAGVNIDSFWGSLYLVFHKLFGMKISIVNNGLYPSVVSNYNILPVFLSVFSLLGFGIFLLKSKPIDSNEVDNTANIAFSFSLAISPFFGSHVLFTILTLWIFKFNLRHIKLIYLISFLSFLISYWQPHLLRGSEGVVFLVFIRNLMVLSIFVLYFIGSSAQKNVVEGSLLKKTKRKKKKK